MNKLKSDINAGIGFEWDDFRWEQAAIREAFYALLSVYGVNPSDSFIITGCQLSGFSPNQNVSAGFISLNGEILKFPGGPVPPKNDPSDVQYFDLKVSYNPDGFEGFENGTSGDTYEERTAEIKVGPAPADYMKITAPSIGYKMALLLNSYLQLVNYGVNAFQQIPTSVVLNEPQVSPFYTPAANLTPKYKIDSCGNVTISGGFICNSSTGYDVVFLSPNMSPVGASYIPAFAHLFDSSGNFLEFRRLIVKQSGGSWVVGFNAAGDLPAVGQRIDFQITYPKQ